MDSCGTSLVDGVFATDHCGGSGGFSGWMYDTLSDSQRDLSLGSQQRRASGCLPV